MNGEHSPLDALIPAYIFNDMFKKEMKDLKIPTGNALSFEKVEWDVNEDITTALVTAQKEVNITVNDSDIQIEFFTEFGTDIIKTCRFSIGSLRQSAFPLTLLFK